MAVAFRSDASATASTTSPVTLSITKPTGTASGDVLVAHIMMRSTSGLPSCALAGWTSVRKTQGSANIHQMESFVRVAGGSEPATYDFVITSAGSIHVTGGIQAISGGSNTSPVNAHGGAIGTSSTSATAPSIVTNVDDCLVLASFGAQNVRTFTPDGAMTEDWDETVASSVSSEGAHDNALVSAGATGTRTATISSSVNSISHVVAIAPPAAEVASGDPIYALSYDGYVQSFHATVYSTARAGSTMTVDDTGGDVYVGQIKEGNTYSLREGWLFFDTSGIPDAATITGVTLSVYGSVGTAAQWPIDVYANDPGLQLTGTDWLDGTELGALTPLLASFDTGSGGASFSTSGYNAFTENGDNFKNAIDKGGVTKLLLVSRKQIDNTAPTGEERVLLKSAETSAFTQDPKLVVTYTVTTNLVVQDATHSHTSDNLALTQAHTLAVADSEHNHTAQNLALTQAHSLTVQDSSHSHTVENLVLETESDTELEIQDASHGHSVENLDLTQLHSLTVSDATHAHTSESFALAQAHSLAVQDSSHDHTSETPSLTQAHALTIQDSTHPHTAEQLTLVYNVTLVVQDSSHAHSADAPALTQIHQLTVQDSSHGHSSETPSLTQLHLLVVSDASHSHTAEEITVTQLGELRDVEWIIGAPRGTFRIGEPNGGHWDAGSPDGTWKTKEPEGAYEAGSPRATHKVGVPRE